MEVTFGVENLAATIAAIEANGGRMVTQAYKLEGVGELAYFEDTEGNVLCVCQYEREDG